MFYQNIAIFLGMAKPVDDHQMVVLIAKAPSNGAGVRHGAARFDRALAFSPMV
jgi:hypothetical protein